MKNKSFRILCSLPAQTALERVKHLLSCEGVTYTLSDLSVRSTRTPMALPTGQPILYTRKNWVGLNPFIYVSGVEIRCEPNDAATTMVTVDVDRRRAVMWMLPSIGSFVLAASALPQPAGVLLLLAGSCALWFGTVDFLGGYLIRKEIGDDLKAPTGSTSSA